MSPLALGGHSGDVSQCPGTSRTPDLAVGLVISAEQGSFPATRPRGAWPVSDYSGDREVAIVFGFNGGYAMQFLGWVIVSAAIWAVTGVAALAQQPPSAQAAAQKLMAVPGSKYPGRMHVLPATMETTQWGWFDNAELPRLFVDSGDTVAIESMSHSHGQLWPGRTIEELKKLRTDWPGRGPMTLTGPIFVNGAEPGDTLQIKIQKIVPRPWGANFNVPGLFGQFPKNFPDGQVKYFYLDNERKTAEFAPGIEIPLRPFPGTLGVARKEPGRYNAVPPGAIRRKSGQPRSGRRNDAARSCFRARRPGLARRFPRGARKRRDQPDWTRNRIPGNHPDNHG